MREFVRPLLCAVLLALSGGLVPAAEGDGGDAGDPKTEGPIALPPKERFKLVLLAGQSNMAGRGKVEEQDRSPHPRVLMMDKEGRWVPAVDPVHFDKPRAGVGPGRSFGILLAESDPDIVVGLVPAACGGSPITTWKPGAYFKGTDSHPYDDMLARARKAAEDGVFAAALWHQGESDSGKRESSEKYGERLAELIARIRAELDAPTLPFLIGQLPQAPEKPWSEFKKGVDAAHRALGEGDNNAFVSSDGLTTNADNVHLDAASQREFGKRYFAAWAKIARPGTPATPPAP